MQYAQYASNVKICERVLTADEYAILEWSKCQNYINSFYRT